MANKDLNHYLSLPYTLVIKPMDDESGRYYYGTYLELDGCQSHGETVEELLRNLEEAKRGWLEVKLEHGDPIPEPQEEYSGKINLRMPKSLHRQLAVEAQLEGVSLNQYMLYKLSK
ncbi:type II toxin-antitoxin system HicB family antitoxin [Brevibacillus aydinogluensis]|jgi:predicted HicB family RNase H-like nuclease|uniref:Toxin-antitoxin system HicB family antitoxin n=1 Tax=Brevibacillus aydinogluensis TaxID=927786 RepID=A0AA48RFS8_9BACL|nr:toxin-antitoxin system HicB family antitoxin [Brevibacillus aydinogluensis]CAJ1001051.1 toxin-antitoxin system HicB family antitoxin [Brevibacillus aydinogluensis]